METWRSTSRADLVVDNVQPPSKKGTVVDVPYLSLNNLVLLAPKTTAWERLREEERQARKLPLEPEADRRVRSPRSEIEFEKRGQSSNRFNFVSRLAGTVQPST